MAKHALLVLAAISMVTADAASDAKRYTKSTYPVSSKSEPEPDWLQWFGKNGLTSSMILCPFAFVAGIFWGIASIPKDDMGRTELPSWHPVVEDEDVWINAWSNEVTPDWRDTNVRYVTDKVEAERFLDKRYAQLEEVNQQIEQIALDVDEATEIRILKDDARMTTEEYHEYARDAKELELHIDILEGNIADRLTIAEGLMLVFLVLASASIICLIFHAVSNRKWVMGGKSWAIGITKGLSVVGVLVSLNSAIITDVLAPNAFEGGMGYLWIFGGGSLGCIALVWMVYLCKSKHCAAQEPLGAVVIHK